MSFASGQDLLEEDLQQRMTAFLNSCTIKPPPHLTWDKVIGCEDAKRDLYQKIVLPHKLLELPQYYDDGVPTPGDVIMEGQSGSGRTRMAFTAAATSQADFFCVINCVEIFSNFGIESSIFIRMLFNTARKHSRSVIYFRNLDCFEYDCNWVLLPAKAELKQQMDFYQERYRFVKGKLESISVIGAARSFKHLDPGILNRFEKRVSVPLPNSKQRLQMLLMFMGDARTSFYDTDWKILVENTEGCTGRYLHTICQNVITTSRAYSLSFSSKDSDRVETSCINLDSFSRWVPVRKAVVSNVPSVPVPPTIVMGESTLQQNKNGDKTETSTTSQILAVKKQGAPVSHTPFVSCS